MKIFNWAHKRFHHSTLKDGFASNMKTTEHTINNADSQALLKQVALDDLLGGWKDGILTIGTLGYDPLKSFNQNREYFALGNEDEVDKDYGEHIIVEGNDEDNYNVEHEELHPLMHTTFEHNFEDAVSAKSNHDANASKKEVVMTINQAVLTPTVTSHEFMESNEVETDQKKKKGERTTLADLFLADTDVNIKMDPAKVMLQSSEKPSLKAKHRMSFTKKFIPRVKDNPHPIKDIKKLVKKMLKSKIHPDLNVKNHKLESQKGSNAGINDNHKHGASDSTSLLPI